MIWNGRACVPYVSVQSGYEQACLLLDRDPGLRRGAATPAWEIFSAFTGVEFVDVTDDLAAALAGNPADADAAMLATFRRLARNGITHVVMDYLLWLKLTERDTPNLRDFVKNHPPTHIIPNPVASLRQVRAECQLPDWLASEPLAQKILIYRRNDE
ncbi:MAG: hypothetical protein FJ279_27415 [Planctomycetes bacterium]|nr:hypothetical protein [Planctomycetota bacterium]